MGSIMRLLAAFACALLLICLRVLPGYAEKRVALVVGNGDYQHADRLANPVTDARRLRDALAQLKFEIVYGEDLTKPALEETLRRFADAAREADVVLAFFAGHGATFGGTPYLVPVDARFASLADVPNELVPVETLVGELRRSKGLRIAILDACRDNDAERALKLKALRGAQITRGLGRVQSPEGLILAYATQYLSTAADGDPSGDSPFTAALLRHIATPGLDVKDLFAKVGSEVIANTKGAQRPEISISFYDSYALVPTDPVTPAPGPPPPDRAGQVWANIQNSTNPAVLEDFVRQFGTTAYASLARARLEELRKAAGTPGESALKTKLRALVVGNAQYATAPSLTNPANDAQAMAGSLRELGFEVTLALNLDKASFERQVRDFANALDGASAAVFFYAGHGLQIDGRNYMVPVDAKMTDEADLPFELVSLDIVLQRLAHNRVTSIIFLDACRNEQLGDKLAKSLGARANAVGQGLAGVYASVGTLISFSTQPGNFALDGDGRNSPFTSALLRHIPTPNVDVLSVMKQVRRDVVEETRNAQVPWDNSSLVDDFYFRAKAETDRLPRRKEASVDPASDKDRPILTGRPPVLDCDLIAASPTDPERMAAGKTFGELNGAEGVNACRAAIAKYPNTPRFEFQLARSLQKTENYAEAAQLYSRLVEHGYLAALTNYGWLLTNGQGVTKNEGAAVKLYVLAAHQGDTFGMFNVAMAYDSGKGLPYNPVEAAHWIYAALRLGHEYSIKQMSGDAAGWTPEFRLELQRLLRRAGVYGGPLNGVFGPEIGRAVRIVQTLPNAPKPGGDVPTQRFDPSSIPVNSPPPRQ
jgi:uncharacterized caspase-like protein